MPSFLRSWLATIKIFESWCSTYGFHGADHRIFLRLYLVRWRRSAGLFISQLQLGRWRWLVWVAESFRLGWPRCWCAWLMNFATASSSHKNTGCRLACANALRKWFQAQRKKLEVMPSVIRCPALLIGQWKSVNHANVRVARTLNAVALYLGYFYRTLRCHWEVLTHFRCAR